MLHVLCGSGCCHVEKRTGLDTKPGWLEGGSLKNFNVLLFAQIFCEYM